MNGVRGRRCKDEREFEAEKFAGLYFFAEIVH
jgi:hypothetical protein